MSETGFGTGASIKESRKVRGKAVRTESDKRSPFAPDEISGEPDNPYTTEGDVSKTDPKVSTEMEPVGTSSAKARVNSFHHTILLSTTKPSESKSFTDDTAATA